MALGNKRGPKRSSSSTASTITTLVFIALCVIGVWMLTTNSFTPPQTTTRTATATTSKTFSEDPDTNKYDDRKDQTVFEDNPGLLPNDAIQSDDQNGREDNSTGRPFTNQRHHERLNIGGVTKPDEDERKQIIKENVKRREDMRSKQKQGETQISEESALTQQQLIGNNGNKKETKSTEEMIKQQLQEDAGNQTVNSQEQENQLSDEDNKKRMKQHQDQHVQQKQDTPKNFTTFSDTTLPEKQQPDDKLKTPQQTAQMPQRTTEHKRTNSNSGDTHHGIPQESSESKKSSSAQAIQSETQKERRIEEPHSNHTWQLCNETAGPDFIPCLDNQKAISKLPSTMHYEHRERHCPEKGPSCLVPIPEGYKRSIEWPKSRNKIWYRNVPYTTLAEMKGHQNWVKVRGEFLTFPGGGTQFIHGALHYIDFIQQALPNIAWGKHSRVVLDVGCGVASFGGYLFERDVLTMSFAPKDEHEAQVQFALERGIPAISAVMGSQRLPFPSNVFDLIHCARCRVPWHIEGGKLLLELNRVLRPGGYFVWSATPVYQRLEEDVEIWKAMSSLTVAMCWELVTIKMDRLNSVGFAIYRKPTTNECYDKRNHNNPPMCTNEDDPNAAWYVPLQSCLHRVNTDKAVRGSQWPVEWPNRLYTAPYWLNSSQMGIYGIPFPQDFIKDQKHWKHVVNSLYLKGLGFSWSDVRSVMDMRAVYGGFAAALKNLPLWVMNVVNTNAPDTLPIIYERGLFGIYHDWCESFSTYPRSYDLLHADHLFSKLKQRCSIIPVMAEVDRIVRPGGNLIVRDLTMVIAEVENLLKSLHWEIRFINSKDQEGVLSAQKGDWRPQTYLQAASS
ncbi:hypothetical protein Patl1_28993 [Pistacia atlantica]|uniref:Uncharacterized protein n=1 Tax=Pistacia atlantica TaxID=434234 RepID=A0ACC1BEV2_9ROSI|nr:hypothetical protein Patl1_28993 [Pistacia atlantica]